MKIGLFTDTYFPSINGIVFVVKSLREHLEAQGHEVYVFCPARSLRRDKYAADLEEEDERIFRFPSVKGAFYDDYDTSIFFPPRVVTRIRELDLDVLHIFTPGQVGLLGMQTARKNNTPLVIQHCTDIYQFVEHYPAVLPGALALVSLVVPFTVKLRGKDIRELAKLYRPRRGATRWNQDIIERAITVVYSKADAIITLSRKSTEQLLSWQTEEYRYPVVMMPNGVDALPRATNAQLTTFREQYGIDERDEVFGFVGRLGEEKNLPILIAALGHILKKRPRARLLFVGDFEYREELERMASETEYADRITFTGALPRQDLGVAYRAMSVFTFPSLKDTQGWVLHEAAHAGLPIVLIDREVSEVVIDGENGYYARNTARNMADKIVTLLASPKKRASFSVRSKQLARRFTEKRQVKKLEQLYIDVIDAHYREEMVGDE